MTYRNVLKIGVIGPTFVGKSTLCNVLAERMVFLDEYYATIGVDLIVKYFDDNGRTYKLLLWDFAGNERYNDITESYIRQMHVILYCYSASEYESFIKMKEKYQLDKESGRLESKHIIICMCKCDSIDKVNNLDTIGEDFAKIHSYDFICTSSSKKIGLLKLLHSLTKKEIISENTENKLSYFQKPKKSHKCIIL